jgi:hypothetical protein
MARAHESGNGRSSGKCPLTSNGHHLFAIFQKKCYRCSRLDHRFEVSSTLHQKLFLYDFVYAAKIVL